SREIFFALTEPLGLGLERAPGCLEQLGMQVARERVRDLAAVGRLLLGSLGLLLFGRGELRLRRGRAPLGRSASLVLRAWFGAPVFDLELAFVVDRDKAARLCPLGRVNALS